MKYLLTILISYLAGSIPFGLLIGKLKGIDIRQHGSHNIGATNVTRVLGKPLGRCCFFCDFLKGSLPVFFLSAHGGSNWCGVLAAISAILGHVYPVWLRFKGGKGVATCLGALLALSWLPVLIGAVAWVILFFKTRIVAIASIATVIVIPVSAVVLRFCRCSCGGTSWPVIGVMVVIALLVIWKHSENIARLRAGKELAFKQ